MSIVILCVIEIVVLMNNIYFKNALHSRLPAGALKFAARFNLHSDLNTLLFSFHLASICQSRPLHNIRATDDRPFLRFRPRQQHQRPAWFPRSLPDSLASRENQSVGAPVRVSLVIRNFRSFMKKRITVLFFEQYGFQSARCLMRPAVPKGV